jgi:hypothetical protein
MPFAVPGCRTAKPPFPVVHIGRINFVQVLKLREVYFKKKLREVALVAKRLSDLN